MGIHERIADLEAKARSGERPDADRWRGLLFATNGQLAAAMPPGVVQEMPVDVWAKPTVSMPPASTATGGLIQPARVRPE